MDQPELIVRLVSALVSPPSAASLRSLAHALSLTALIRPVTRSASHICLTALPSLHPLPLSAVSQFLLFQADALDVPVLCKIRVFSEVSDTVRYAKMLVDAGASVLAVHGRTRCKYKARHYADC